MAAALVCTTTHDAKRSEDTRARINVLSDIPRLWRKAVNHWARLNRRHCREVDGQRAPSRNDEYLFYQSLVGAWPLRPPQGKQLRALADRMAAYMEKATREAKLHTSWISPNAEYDATLREFVGAALDDHPKNRFLAEFRGFHEQVVNWGLYTRLGAGAFETDLARRARHLPRSGNMGFQPGRPGQPAVRGFCARRRMLARLRKSIGRNERSLLSLARQLAGRREIAGLSCSLHGECSNSAANTRIFFGSAAIFR